MSKEKVVASILAENVFLAYEEISQTYRRGSAWIELLSNLENEGKIVLDAGCGSGLHSIYLAERDFSVIGLDISYGMVKRLAKTASRKKLTAYVDAVTGDMRYLPFRDKLFDYIIAIASIHHVPLYRERVKVIEEFNRVLKERGVLVVSVWSLLQPSLLLRALKTWIMKQGFEFGDVFVSWKTKRRKVERFFHLFTRAELLRLITSKGLFKIVRVCGWSPKKGLLARNFVVEAVKSGDT